MKIVHSSYGVSTANEVAIWGNLDKKYFNKRKQKGDSKKDRPFNMHKNTKKARCGDM